MYKAANISNITFTGQDPFFGALSKTILIVLYE